MLFMKQRTRRLERCYHGHARVAVAFRAPRAWRCTVSRRLIRVSLLAAVAGDDGPLHPESHSVQGEIAAASVGKKNDRLRVVYHEQQTNEEENQLRGQS